EYRAHVAPGLLQCRKQQFALVEQKRRLKFAVGHEHRDVRRQKAFEWRALRVFRLVRTEVSCIALVRRDFRQVVIPRDEDQPCETVSARGMEAWLGGVSADMRGAGGMSGEENAIRIAAVF